MTASEHDDADDDYAPDDHGPEMTQRQDSHQMRDEHASDQHIADGAEPEALPPMVDESMRVGTVDREDIEREDSSELEQDNATGEVPVVTESAPTAQKRVRRPPTRFWEVANVSTDGPKSFVKAMSGPQRLQWEEAVKKELDTLQGLDAWDIVPRTEHMRPITTTWRFVEKWNDDTGEFVKAKARLCARGDHQRPGIDFKEVFAAVAPAYILRIFSAIAVSKQWLLKRIDIKCAFLHAPLEEEVYIHPPLGLRVPPNSVCRLKRSLYGLRQSGRNWMLSLEECLLSDGFTQLASEPCVYVRQDERGYCALASHVDDLNAMFDCQAVYEEVLHRPLEV